jgi:hypothetical protein
LRCCTCTYIKVVAEWVSGLAQAEVPPLLSFIRLFHSFVQNQLVPWQPPHASLLPIVRGVIRCNLGRSTPCCLGSRPHILSAANVSNRSSSSHAQSICSVSSPNLDLDLYQGARHNGVWSQRPWVPIRPFKGRQQTALKHVEALGNPLHTGPAQTYMLDMLTKRLEWDTDLSFLVCFLDNSAFRASLRRSSHCPLGSLRIIDQQIRAV